MKLFLLFLIFFQISYSFSKENNSDKKKITPEQFEISSIITVAPKIKSIIENINSFLPSIKEKKKLKKNILILDSLLEHISNKDIKNIVETELFKAFLSKDNSSKSYSLKYLNVKKLELVKGLVKNQDVSRFAQAITNSIIIDIESILTNAKFNTFHLLKKQNRKVSSMSRDMRKFDKKLTFLIPFISKLVEMGPKNFSQYIEEKLVISFYNIVNTINIQVKYSNFETITPRLNIDELKFFKVNSIDPTKKSKTLKKFELFPEPIDNYLTPEELPKPVSNWAPMDDLNEIEKLKNNNDKSALPSPVEDWLDSI